MIEYDQHIIAFILSCQNEQVKMLLVGGAAVNFHGYRRHSADIDFWIDASLENMNKLKRALNNIDIEIEAFPDEVLNQEQNISIKISPITDLELITKFNPGCSFDEAYNASVNRAIEDIEIKVVDLNTLISSKLKSGRSKDLLDVLELKKINNIE